MLCLNNNNNINKGQEKQNINNGA